MPAPSLDGTSLVTESFFNRTTSTTFASNKTSTGSNRYAVLALMGTASNGGVITSAPTYGGNAMTLIGEATLNAGGSHSLCSVWGYKMPPTGASAVVWVPTVDFFGYGVVMTFQDVDQTTPFDGVQTGYDAGTNPYGLTVSSATDDLVIGCLGHYAINPTPSGTQIAEGHDGTAATSYGNAMYKAGAASVTMDWSDLWTSGNSAVVAFNLNQASGGGGSPDYSKLLLLGVG